MKELHEIMAAMQPDMTETLRRWIAIPSVKAEPLPGAPFGKAVREALDAALADCERLGLEVKNYDGYIGTASMGEGSDEDALAILAHLDVVPEGDGWAYPPFGGEIVDGKMYGRGTSDDKGPAAAALFAMKAVLDAGVPLKRKVMLILGCDEESGWEDIRHYNKVAVMPRMGFSPDAGYPVINIEKGLCHLSLRAAMDNAGPEVVAFNAGERPNVVPGKAEALLRGDRALLDKATEAASKLGVDVSGAMAGGCVRLTSIGINGHAAMPRSARNAIGQMLLVLREIGVTGSLAALADKVGMEYDGKSLGAAVQDGVSGELTCNMGIIRADSKGVYATLDIRYPVLANPEAMIAGIKSALPGFDIAVDGLKEPHHVPENSELVRNLLDAYTGVTGLPGYCIAIGGGTYARSLKEGVAFGAAFPGGEDLAHQANEYANLRELEQNMKIFASAIVKLAGKA